MPNFTPETAAFVSELDAAVDAHMDWSRRVLRCAVLRTSPGEDVLAPLAHTLCRFGTWLVQNEAQFEQLDVQAARRLEAVHQTMHDAIRSICLDVLAERPGKGSDLEVFEAAQSELITLLAGFKTEFLATAVRRDPLTGLPLRHGVEHDFALIQQICKRTRLLHYVMMIDVDHFKLINDTHGHPAGDAVLRELAQTLKHIKRENEPLYRFGGEEFLLLMQCDSPEGAAHAAQRFLREVRNLRVQVAPSTSLALTVTLGLTRVGDGEDLDGAIHRADKALYEGKRAGRDRFVMASDD